MQTTESNTRPVAAQQAGGDAAGDIFDSPFWLEGNEFDQYSNGDSANSVNDCAPRNKKSRALAGSYSSKSRNVMDYYPTPREATDALLDFLRLGRSTVVWEPACGQGHMVKVLREHVDSVLATDISEGHDFFRYAPAARFDWVITNPPFSSAPEFIARALSFKRPVAMLLKSQFWHAKSRLALFNESKPSYVLPLTWRPNFAPNPGSPTMDVLWTVWKRDNSECRYIPLQKPRGGGPSDGEIAWEFADSATQPEVLPKNGVGNDRAGPSREAGAPDLQDASVLLPRSSERGSL